MKERAEAVAKLVSEKTGRKANTSEVLKNNKKLHGIAIETEQEGVFATIYINGMEKLEDEAIADKVIVAFEESETRQFDLEKMSTKEYIQEHVIPCVIGRKGNEEFLVKYANVQFLELDLAYTLRVMIPEEGGSYLLNNEMVEKIGCNVPDLFRCARENMVRDYKARILPMEDVIASMMGGAKNLTRMFQTGSVAWLY